MMKISKFPKREDWDTLCKRPAIESDYLEGKIREIFKKVREDGDQCLREYAKLFDGVDITAIKVTNDEIREAEKCVPAILKEAIRSAQANISKFHKTQLVSEPQVETMPGIRCWRKNVPIENVGLYIPGGSAPLFSTVLMLGIPARMAGSRKVIICTPPRKDGSVHPAVLYASKLIGIMDIYKVGGAQAIAAMAYGTETIPQVYKIFGPGNQYVTKAKELAQLKGTAIDMPAGPSEVLVIADKSANPAFVAADLLSQAEHGPDSQVILLSDDEQLINSVQISLTEQIKYLQRKTMAASSLQNSHAILFDSLNTSIDFSNAYAPEHLILIINNANDAAERVVNAGSVFIGPFSCESIGDYASGTNHTLPTTGYAKTYSGVSVDSFLKKITFQEITKTGLLNIGSTVRTLAEAEQLEAHKNAVNIRLKYIVNERS
jgi:histidinol dehydrogenase